MTVFHRHLKFGKKTKKGKAKRRKWEKRERKKKVKRERKKSMINLTHFNFRNFAMRMSQQPFGCNTTINIHLAALTALSKLHPKR